MPSLAPLPLICLAVTAARLDSSDCVGVSRSLETCLMSNFEQTPNKGSSIILTCSMSF